MCEDNRLEDLLEEKANEMARNVFILSSPKQVRTALYTLLILDENQVLTLIFETLGQEVFEGPRGGKQFEANYEEELVVVDNGR